MNRAGIVGVARQKDHAVLIAWFDPGEFLIEIDSAASRHLHIRDNEIVVFRLCQRESLLDGSRRVNLAAAARQRPLQNAHNFRLVIHNQKAPCDGHPVWMTLF